MPDTEPTPLGRRIYELRRGLGLSRVKLARLADLDPESIYNIEAGRSQAMHTRNLERLADALSTTVGYLLTGIPDNGEETAWQRTASAWARTHGSLEDPELLDLLEESYQLLRKMEEERTRRGGGR